MGIHSRTVSSSRNGREGAEGRPRGAGILPRPGGGERRGLQAPGEARGEFAAGEVDLAETFEVALEVVVDLGPAALGKDGEAAGDGRFQTGQEVVAEGGAVRLQVG